MGKISDNIESIKRNYTESTLAHAEQNLGDAPGIVPPAFKLHIQQNAFKAGNQGSGGGNGSFQLKEKGGEKEKSGASFVQNFQSKFNTNLSDVKVQKNSKEADQLGTKAFAKGNQIHFASGAYKPDTKEGQKVLGHELVHVLQQRKGMAAPTGSIKGQQVNEDKGLENQAHAQSDKASKGASVSSSLKGTKAGASQQPVAQGWGFLKKIGSGIKKAAKSVGSGVKKAGSFIGKGVSKVAKKAEGVLGKGLKTGIGFLANQLGLGGIAGKVKGIVGKVGKAVKKGAKGVWGGLKKVGGFAKKGASRLWGGVKKIGGFIKKGAGRVWGGIRKVGGMFGRGAKRMWGKVKRGFSKAKKLAKAGGSFVRNIFNKGKSKLKGLLKKGMSAAGALASMVKSNIKKGVGKVFKAVAKLKSDPLGALKSVAEKIVSGGSAMFGMVKGVGKKILKGAKVLLKKAKKYGSGFWKGLKEVGGGIGGVIKSIVGGLTGGVGDILKGNFKSGGMKILMGGVNGVLGAVDVVLDATVGMIDFTFGSAGEGKEVKGSDIPSQHIMDEFCAHGVSYKDFSALKGGTALNDKEKEVLRKGGYDPDNMIPSQGTHGFQAVLIMPLTKGKNPMLALRGTADMEGALTDADPQQVGHHQFRENSGKILALIQQGGGKVDVTGHSLGGAMAQITAAHFTKHIGRVTTFQSPGINKETVKLFTENMKKMKKGDRPEVNHHTVKNDLVSKAGQENLPGVVYEHDMGEINPLEAHTAWTSGTADRKADRAAFGMTDEFFNNQLGKEIYDESTIMKFKSNPHVFKRALAEAVRSLVGTARDGAVGIFNLGKKGVSKAWNFMKKIPGGLKKASSAGQHLVMKFLRFSKSKKKQLFKSMSNVMKKMSGGMKALIGNLR